jgi:DNA-binding MarR family transcriptional regulator
MKGAAMALGDEERARMRDFLSGLDLFVALSGRIPSQLIRAFCLVAMHEGESVRELKDKAGVSQSVMTRHLSDLGDRNRHKKEGFELVEQKVDLMDRRIHRAYLTPKGKALAARLFRALMK